MNIDQDIQLFSEGNVEIIYCPQSNTIRFERMMSDIFAFLEMTVEEFDKNILEAIDKFNRGHIFLIIILCNKRYDEDNVYYKHWIGRWISQNKEPLFLSRINMK